MVDSFSCPHCRRSYPVLPTLVGRPVRCSSCKQVFKLLYDGRAIKVNAVQSAPVEQSQAGVKQESQKSALESINTEQSKQSGGAKGIAANKTAQSQIPQHKETIKSSPGVRPQTKAIKNHTSKIKKIRESLQAAAELASAPSEAIAERREAEDLGANKAEAASRLALSPAVRVEKSINKNTGIMVFSAIALLIVLAFVFYPSAGSVERTLVEFSKSTQVNYPDRLPAYRNRMWITNRWDSDMPIVTNLAGSEVVSRVKIDWIDVISACSPELDDLIMNDSLGIWHLEKDRMLIEEAWSNYDRSAAVLGFYEQLSRNNIRFFRYDRFQDLLLKKGIPKELVYAVSLLLSGMLSPDAPFDRNKWMTTDSLPIEAELAEFHGRDGLILVDAGGFYEVEEAPRFAGIVFGFRGVKGANQYDASWRVLDLRIDHDFKKYYSARSNPLKLLYKDILSKMRQRQVYNRDMAVE